MEQLTFQKFKGNAGKAMIMMTGIFFYCIYKLFSTGDFSEYVVIAVACLIGVFGILRLVNIAEKAIEDNTYDLKVFDRLITGNVVIGVLAVLGFYLFFVKGLYGLYKLWHNFSWLGLFFRIFVLLLSFQLVSAVSHLQSAYLSIKGKTIGISEK